jgi:hypothetical protein
MHLPGLTEPLHLPRMIIIIILKFGFAKRRHDSSFARHEMSEVPGASHSRGRRECRIVAPVAACAAKGTGVGKLQVRAFSAQ